jgi:hypothetical protein
VRHFEAGVTFEVDASPEDQRHLTAAEGYVELGIFTDAMRNYSA